MITFKPTGRKTFEAGAYISCKPDPGGTEQLRFGDLVLSGNSESTKPRTGTDLTMKEFELLKHSRSILVRC